MSINKFKTSVALSQETLDWVNGQIKSKKFSSVSHAFEYLVEQEKNRG